MDPFYNLNRATTQTADSVFLHANDIWINKWSGPVLIFRRGQEAKPWTKYGLLVWQGTSERGETASQADLESMLPGSIAVVQNLGIDGSDTSWYGSLEVFVLTPSGWLWCSTLPPQIGVSPPWSAEELARYGADPSKNLCLAYEEIEN